MLIKISNMLNDKLSGLTLEQISLKVINDIEEEAGVPRDILLPVLEGAAECINLIDNPEIYLEGATNIFKLS